MIEMFRYVELCRYVTNFVRVSVGVRNRRKQKEHSIQGCYALFGAPAENRTPDTLIKSQVLYQLSYRGMGLKFGLG